MEAEQMDTDLLTAAEAARLLKVSIVTVKRWLKDGRLPAYRLGPRYVRIRRADLSKVLTPVSKGAADAEDEPVLASFAEAAQPLSAEQTVQLEEAIRSAAALRQRILARRGGERLTPSWGLIRQEREERARRA